MKEIKIRSKVKVINNPYISFDANREHRIKSKTGDLVFIEYALREYRFRVEEVELIEEKEVSITSQNQRILLYLQSGATINAVSALELFNCFRLAARIKNLRDLGHDIKTIIVSNGKKSWANYKI